jgi:hypothetical protein
MAVNETDPAGEYNIICRQGDTFTRGVTITTAGTAYNLTNATAAFTVRASEDATVQLSLTNGSGITLGGTAGTALITATATQTSSIEAGVYTYDFTITEGAAVTTFLVGSFTVLGAI